MNRAELEAILARGQRVHPELCSGAYPLAQLPCERSSGSAPVALCGTGRCARHGNALVLSAHLEVSGLPCVECWLDAAWPELRERTAAILDAADPRELLAGLRPELLQLELWLAPVALRWRFSAGAAEVELERASGERRILHVRPALMAFQQPGTQGLAWTWLETRSAWRAAAS